MRTLANRMGTTVCFAAGVAAIATLWGCGDADGNIFLPFDINALSDTDNMDKESGEGESDPGDDGPSIPKDSDSSATTDDLENCRSVPWGASCKTGNRIYNLSFTGVEARTRKTVDISFEELHCEGYNSAVIVAGDVDCTVCPGWYRDVGAEIDDIHDAHAVVIAVSTDDFGRKDISDLDALEETTNLQPDYATGSNPFVYPCRYDFTPYTMVVNLKTAEILGMDSVSFKLSVDRLLYLIQEADQSE